MSTPVSDPLNKPLTAPLSKPLRKPVRFPWLLAYAIGYLIFLYLPVLLLPLFSFNDGTIVAFPMKGFTLKWYAQLGAQDTLLQAMANSLIVGAVTALVATSLGLFAARAYVRYRFKGREVSEGLVMLPLVIPGIIVASSMLVLFISLGLKPSLTTVILGHGCRTTGLRGFRQPRGCASRTSRCAPGPPAAADGRHRSYTARRGRISPR